eukprot:COSAG05_NODE_1599_length_4452_cov_2.249024_3_plen_96_part_00
MDEDANSANALKFALSPTESQAAAAYVPFLMQGERERRAEMAQQVSAPSHLPGFDTDSILFFSTQLCTCVWVTDLACNEGGRGVAAPANAGRRRL